MLRLWFPIFLAMICAAQDPIAPHSAFEPPAAKAAASLALSTKDSPSDLITTGEKTDWNETAPYAEAVEISHRLEKASRFVKVLDIGTTPEGRTMIALVVSKDRAFTPEAAAKTGKVVMLIQSGIHAGEIEGKDTVLMLVRDMVVSKRFAAWLDHMIFVIIPVFNVDGHEDFSPYHRPSQNGPKSTGLRATAQRVNLNRDYIKADTPEMRAWLRVFNSWMPDFHIDNHVTDGADFQYDVTWDMARNQDIAEPAGAWVREKFVPELNDGWKPTATWWLRMARCGRWAAGANFSWRFFRRAIRICIARCRIGRRCWWNRISLKAAKTRAWAHYDIMRHSVETILLDPEGLRRAVREADREMAVARRGSRRSAGLSGREGQRAEPAAGVSHAEERAVQERSDRRDGESVLGGAGRYSDRDSRPDRYYGGGADAAGVSDSGGVEESGRRAGAAWRGDGADRETGDRRNSRLTGFRIRNSRRRRSKGA